MFDASQVITNTTSHTGQTSRSQRSDAPITKPAPKTDPGMHLVEHEDPPPICDEAPYPRLKPGEYSARCVETRVYLEKRFRRWVCRLKYWIIPEGPTRIRVFQSRLRRKANAGRGSEYRRAWIEAHGAAPQRRQKLGHSVFRDKIFVIRVDDMSRRHDGRNHHQADVYSTVKEIVKRSWP